MNLERLRHELDHVGLTVAGVLSGTSADGIDVGFARLRREDGVWVAPELLTFVTRPFPDDVAKTVRGILEGRASCGQRELALLDRDLGRAFGRAVRDVAKMKKHDVDLIGSHGQTIFHHDDREASGPVTLQVGGGDFIAAEAGCPVVADFRQADIAAGGGGAPLSPYADDVVFAGVPEPLCVLNLGGIANLTWIHGKQRLAFDVGPAGALLDGIARYSLGRPFDRDGARASEGAVDARWVAHLLDHPFFEAHPPKSTGRDTFGDAWIRERMQRAPGKPEDQLYGAVLSIARAVRRAREAWTPDPSVPCYLAGGGVHNRALVRALMQDLEGPVAISSQVGVDPDAREALVFAVLAARFVTGEAVTHPEVTGARKGTILGRLSPGPA